MAYKKVVEMLGEKLASLLELTKKWLIDWKVDLKSLLDFFHQMKKDDLLGLLDGTRVISIKNGNDNFIKINANINFIRSQRPDMVLDLSGIMISEFTSKINLVDCFKNLGMKFSEMADFKKYVIEEVKEVSYLPAMSIGRYRFGEPIKDKEILNFIGIKTPEEILWTTTYLLDMYGRTSESFLKKAWRLLIGYIVCPDGIVRAVQLDYSSGHDHWNCYCGKLDSYYKGRQIFIVEKVF